MSVIYPVKWGASAPTITRLDDDTVRVQNEAETDVISFNGNTNATLIVDLPAITGSTNNVVNPPPEPAFLPPALRFETE
jgi:hypothetical protein